MIGTESIYGGWDSQKYFSDPADSRLQDLWHKLAAQHVDTPDMVPNHGLTQRKNEIMELWGLFRKVAPKVVLEIGTAQGGTLAGWCQLAPMDATIIFIDRCVNDCRPRPGDPVHPDIASRHDAVTTGGGGGYLLARGHQRIVPINGWSYEPPVISKLMRELAGRKVDFLFHDASHEASMFLRDFEIYWPLVADGGVFASHDICPSSVPNVNKHEAWAQIVRDCKYSARYEYHGGNGSESFGIGVLIK